jgi:FtsH-binding integral membrane protein
VFTGSGVGLGIYMFNQKVDHEGDSFVRILVWLLFGCTIGALVVYWLGSKLIVFAMLVGGLVSVAVREFNEWRKESP